MLDDPLSAVDANVGRQLFDECINGYLRDSTRILVTHQIHFLKAADYIVVLNDVRMKVFIYLNFYTISIFKKQNSPGLACVDFSNNH